MRDFADADSRDAWRSSWARFPRLAQVVVSAAPAAPAETLSYANEIETLAAAFFDHGLPVPDDYAVEDAQPTDAEARFYQRRRGAGDGRRPHA